MNIVKSLIASVSSLGSTCLHWARFRHTCVLLFLQHGLPGVGILQITYPKSENGVPSPGRGREATISHTWLVPGVDA